MEPGVVAHDGVCQDDVQVGEPATRGRQCAGRIVVECAPSRSVARIAGEFGTPQKRRPVRHSLLRPAAVPVERDGVLIEPTKHGPIACLDFAERQMPAQMPMEKPVARIGGEPGRQKGAGRLCLAALITNMREPVRSMRVVRVCGHGALDLRPRRRELPILGQRHGMMRQEPEIVAVMRGEAVHQHRDLVLLPDAAGSADQAIGVRGSGEDQGVAWPRRCAYKASIAAPVRPANARSK